VRLVADVDASALELRASRRFVETKELREVHVARHRDAHDVRHDAA
jgi:hypothetical protein